MGERRLWFKLASHLGIPLQELQAKTTSTEFLEWTAYLEWDEVHGFHAERWYMASIAAEVRKGHVKNPKSVRIEDCLLKFKVSHGSPRRVTEEDVEERTKRSKMFWGAAIGMKLK